MEKKREAISPSDAVVRTAFGAKNRARLLDAYFGERPLLVASEAWEHVYRLLLWVDQTTGLAHCYESDKSQPGKPWYARTLAFHDWLATAIKSTPASLADELDWLFRRATRDLAAEVLRRATAQQAAASRQRKPYEGRGMPQPGEDPELVSIVREVLGPHLGTEPTTQDWQKLVQRIRQYLSLENKRRNLVGEGFEDVLAAVIKRSPGGERLDVRTRHLLHDLPGFNRARKGDKPNKVDLAVLRGEEGQRTLVTAKWSVRADREKQFTSEYAEYLVSESARKPFEYVFVTNEFDPARLMRACEALSGNALMFTHVVHINTMALRAAHGDSTEESSKAVTGYIKSGRLISLGDWLGQLTKA